MLLENSDCAEYRLAIFYKLGERFAKLPFSFRCAREVCWEKLLNNTLGGCDSCFVTSELKNDGVVSEQHQLWCCGSG